MCRVWFSGQEDTDSRFKGFNKGGLGNFSLQICDLWEEARTALCETETIFIQLGRVPATFSAIGGSGANRCIDRNFICCAEDVMSELIKSKENCPNFVVPIVGDARPALLTEKEKPPEALNLRRSRFLNVWFVGSRLTGAP